MLAQSEGMSWFKLPVLLGVVVAAEEVLGMTERGEPVSTGDKAIPTFCHPRQNQVLGEVMAALMGAIGTES